MLMCSLKIDHLLPAPISCCVPRPFLVQSDRWPGTVGVFFLSPVYPTVGCAAISEMKSGAKLLFFILKRRPFAAFAHLLRGTSFGLMRQLIGPEKRKPKRSENFWAAAPHRRGSLQCNFGGPEKPRNGRFPSFSKENRNGISPYPFLL